MREHLMRLRRHLFPNGWASGFVLYVFIVMLFVGIAVHRDYGVSVDEPALRKFGNDVFAYLFRGGAVPAEQDWAFFNPAPQVVMRGAELVLGLTDGGEIWFMRHLLNFFLFFGTIVVLYKMAVARFRTWTLPLLGSVMFFVSPRLFAHGFYNPKDIPAMFFFMLSAWTLLRYLERKTIIRFLIHGVCTALLISMRASGLVLPLIAVTFLFVQESDMRNGVRRAVDYFLVLLVALFIVWPMLWTHPLSGLFGAFMNTTTRSGGGFYFGQAFSAAGVPWHYLPVWIGITTPMIYSIFFSIGFLVLWFRMIQRPSQSLKERPAMTIALLWFTVPMIALMTLPIGIFDEWRHMLFLYPAFLLIALEGIAFLMKIFRKIPYSSLVICGIVLVQILSTSYWIVLHHPFEYGYFSVPTHFIAGKFDLDYWGLSYRAGLEWIARNDNREHINIYTAARVGKAAADTLPLDDWTRLYFVQAEKADYILDNFREHEYRDVLADDRKASSINVDGLELLAIYKGPDRQKLFPLIEW